MRAICSQPRRRRGWGSGYAGRMATVRIALAQINPTVGDLEGNRWLIERAIADAMAAGADLVALPELAVTGYPPEDLVLRPSFVADNLRTLENLAPVPTAIPPPAPPPALPP